MAFFAKYFPEFSAFTLIIPQDGLETMIPSPEKEWNKTFYLYQPDKISKN